MRQKQQAETMRQAQMKKLQMEEEQRRAEQRKRQEQDACSMIRAVCQKLRFVQADKFQQVQQELYDVMQRELNNCGMNMARIRQECDAMVEQTRKRIQDAQDAKAREEQRKVEMAEAHKLACQKAEELVGEFTAKVEAAEQAAKVLAEKAELFTAEDSEILDMTEDKIEEASANIEEAREQASQRSKDCQEYLNEHRSTMLVQDLPGQPPAEIKQTLNKIMERLTEATKKKDSVMLKIHLVKNKALKRTKAKKAMQLRAVKFKKYADKEKRISKKEMKDFAKKEHGFTLTDAAVSKILKALESPSGVAEKDFQRLRVQIGICRERAKDQARRQQREAREKELEGTKEELRTKVAELDGEADAIEPAVKKVEESMEELAKVDGDVRSSHMQQQCAEVAQQMKAAQDKIGAVRNKAAELREGTDMELKAFIVTECKAVDGKCQAFERRVREVAKMHSKSENDAKQKESVEVATCQKKAMAMLKHHQKIKDLTTQDMATSLCADEETVTKESFLAFFESCEKEDGAEAPLSEDLGKYFDLLDDESEGFLTKEHMLTLLRTLKKVVKETTITNAAEVSDESETIAKLEVGDVVELLTEPSEQGELLRAKCRSMKDGAEGWVTLKGNQGSVFLMDGGFVWRVQKETILTKGFDLSTMADADRKLSPGELVGLREWMRKDEGSGLMRMKCKTKSDGKVGWATAIGNTGTVFLTVH